MHRDADTQWTMRDLFQKAEVPQNVHIGVVWQLDRETDAAFMRLAGEQRWMPQVASLDMCIPCVRMYIPSLASFLQHCHDGMDCSTAKTSILYLDYLDLY